MAHPDILTLTDEDFDTQVKAKRYLLVDFWAEWCGPCRMVAPALEELATEYKDRVAVGKISGALLPGGKPLNGGLSGKAGTTAIPATAGDN